MTLATAAQGAGLPTTSYLTVAEYRAAPTDVDLTSLVPNGSRQQQDDALAAVIARASAAMDSYVHYTLGATVNTETAQPRVRRDGTIRVVARAKPILEVDTFLAGPTPSKLTAIPAAAAADIWIEDNVIEVPLWSGAFPFWAALGGRVFAKWTYANGYANTLLAATAAAGASSLQVVSALGIYPGTSLTIYDSGLSETVTVAGSYVPGQTTVPLTTPLLNQHLTVGISVSALLPDMKEAAILFTSGFIKTGRGSAGLVMDSVEQARPRQDQSEGGGRADFARAKELLRSFVLPAY